MLLSTSSVFINDLREKLTAGHLSSPSCILLVIILIFEKVFSQRCTVVEHFTNCWFSFELFFAEELRKSGIYAISVQIFEI